MGVFLIALFCILERVPGVVLRYLPFRKVITPKQKKLLFGSYAVMFVLSFFLFLELWSSTGFSDPFYQITFSMFSFFLMMINICVIRGRLWEHVFTAGLSMCMITMVVTIVSAVVNMNTVLDEAWKPVSDVVLTTLISLIALPLFNHLISNTVTPFLTGENKYYWSSIWLVPWLLYITGVSVLPADHLLISFEHVKTIVLLNGTAVTMCYCIAEDYKRIQAYNLSVQLMERQKEYYEQLEERVEEARKIRHDFKNHLMAIRGFADRDDKAGLRQYCDEVQLSQNSGIPIPYTGNAAADGVIYHFMEQAQEHEIEFHVSGTFEKHGIADIDLCVLLGNALDNAVTGCCQTGEERWIDLSVQTDGDVIAIMIRNTFDGVIIEGEGRILSRKRKNQPGIGLKSMKDICRKYQGTLQVRYDGTEFSCLILLNRDNQN